MPLDRLEKTLSEKLAELNKAGIAKGAEPVITGIRHSRGNKGPRFLIAGQAGREYIKMNSNSYLGMSLRKGVIAAEQKAAEKFGVGPGAVRFIHGTFQPHKELEKKLAKFHRKEAGMLFSSAYTAVSGVLFSLISPETIVLSDALNHNCIINGIRLARPKDKKIYSHLNMEELKARLQESIGNCRRVIIVTDGIFSMRGDYPDSKQLVELAHQFHPEFEEGVLTIMDDSHGVGALGRTGRGVCEETGAGVDILISTLGKSLGVNGGYVVTTALLVEYLRETVPFYIYSNPITPSEAAAALKALEILDSKSGRKMLVYLRSITDYFRKGVQKLGYETIEGKHPIVVLLIRDTEKTTRLVNYLRENGILAVGLKYPVVPKGDECIRMQISANHTRQDLAYVLAVLARYKSLTRK